MAREGYRLWFGKCNDFNLHGVFSRPVLKAEARATRLANKRKRAKTRHAAVRKSCCTVLG